MVDVVQISTFGWWSLDLINVVNSLASARIQGFLQKKRLNARGFAREFLQSGMLYRPGKRLKKRSKSSSLHSKKIFLLGSAVFLWVTS